MIFRISIKICIGEHIFYQNTISTKKLDLTPPQLFLLNFILRSPTGRILGGKYFLIKDILFGADFDADSEYHIYFASK